MLLKLVLAILRRQILLLRRHRTREVMWLQLPQLAVRRNEQILSGIICPAFVDEKFIFASLDGARHRAQRDLVQATEGM